MLAAPPTAATPPAPHQPDIKKAFVRQARGAAAGAPIAAATGAREDSRAHMGAGAPACMSAHARTRVCTRFPPGTPPLVGASEVTVGALTLDCGPGAADEQRYVPYIALPPSGPLQAPPQAAQAQEPQRSQQAQQQLKPAQAQPLQAPAKAAPQDPCKARTGWLTNQEFTGETVNVPSSSPEECCTMCQVRMRQRAAAAGPTKCCWARPLTVR